MVTNELPAVSQVRSQVSEAEWEQRVNLAACYRAVALHQWDDLIFTHISARVPGPDDHFLINPFGMLFDEITASSLVKIDLSGDKVMDSPFSINPAGFVIHSAVHAARKDAQCVLHLHCPAGVAVASQKAGVLPVSQQSMFVLSSLAYHNYEGVALKDEEKPRLVADLGDKTFLMLRNHGLLTLAESIADAFPGHVCIRKRLPHSAVSSKWWQRIDQYRPTHYCWSSGSSEAGDIEHGRQHRLVGIAAQTRQARSELSYVVFDHSPSRAEQPMPYRMWAVQSGMLIC